MWLTVRSDRGITIEFWSGERGKPLVVLEATEEMSLAQWALVQRQFRNLGLKPRPVGWHRYAPSPHA